LKDILIIGSGLAGCQAAFHSRKENLSFDLISDLKLKSASKVATGVFNPVVLRHITISWNAKEVFNYGFEVYKSINKITNSNVFVKQNIYRPVYDEGESNNWLSKQKTEPFNEFLIHHKNHDINSIVKPMFWGEIKSSGRLNTNLFTQLVLDKIVTPANFINQEFKYELLNINIDNFEYLGNKYKNIIFCEGSYNSENPYFQDLPINATKGEIHTFDLKNHTTKKIISKGVFVAPSLISSNYEVGSTFDWSSKTWLPTEKGALQIQNKLELFFNNKITHISGKAGLRPTTKDRKPIVGEHQKIKNMFILNGMGAKGVSLSPYCAKQLIELIKFNKPTNPEISINRFY
jgi:glycine oxidase